MEALAFNTLDTQCGNLFATVGRDQAAVYDDQHMGDFIGVVVHFVNQPTPHTKGGVRPVAWRTRDRYMMLLGVAGWLARWTNFKLGRACSATALCSCMRCIAQLADFSLRINAWKHASP